MKRTMFRGGLIALMTSVLVACGGGGSDGINGAPGETTTVTSPGIQVGSLTPDQWAALQLQGQITNVTINGKPEVTFTLTDKNGNAVVGLENNYSMIPGQKMPTQRTVTATIAKLVAGQNGSPSYWVNYIVVNVDPTKTDGSFTNTLRAPSTDNLGTLTYLGKGQYKYTFATNIQNVAPFIAASTDPMKGDLGNTSFDPSNYRVVLQISGAARGTGTNTPDGVQVAPAVNLANPLNLWYDQGSLQRNIATISSCNECHQKLAFHGGGRVEVQYCVTCHTNQRKYNQTPASLGTTVWKWDNGETVTLASWSKEPRKFPNGQAFRDMTIMTHGIHAGKFLPVRIMPTDPATGQNSSGDYVDGVAFPQFMANCSHCHTADKASPNYQAQGDSWKTNPSRYACGACHNAIDFATGKNVITGASAHPVQTDDSKCASCHTSTAIASVYHVSVDPVGSEGRGGYPVNTAQDVPTPGYPAGQGPPIPLAAFNNPTAGVPRFNFEISTVTVASNKATIKYRILMDGSPVTFLAKEATPKGYLLPGIDGTPSLYVSYGQKKDGVATVVDWTASINTTVLNCRNQVATACTQTGPDASGFYTATLATALPADAQLVTGMLGINYQGFVKLDHPEYPKGIRIREPGFAIKAATGYTARRAIVSNAKCNSCHSQLGVEPSFHSGARNNGEGCATGGCHWQSYSTGHTGAANNYGGGWSLSSKNMVHAIHGSGMRNTQTVWNSTQLNYFNYEANARNLKGLGEVEYPGILNQCEQCHVPGSYNFQIAANAAAVPNLLWSTDADKDMTTPAGVTPIGLSPWINTLGKGQINYTTDNLVSSPIASTCFGCHGDKTAIMHMQANGGRLLQSVNAITGKTGNDRTLLTQNNTEQCMVCHAAGTSGDIALVHGVK